MSLLFTALNNQFCNTDMSRPMGDLSVVIVQFAISPYDNRVQLAWGGTPLIALLVRAISIGARLRFRQSSKD